MTNESETKTNLSNTTNLPYVQCVLRSTQFETRPRNRVPWSSLWVSYIPFYSSLI